MNIVKIMIPTSMMVYLQSGDTARQGLKALARHSSGDEFMRILNG